MSKDNPVMRRIGAHFGRNRDRYLCGAGGVLLGGVATYASMRGGGNPKLVQKVTGVMYKPVIKLVAEQIVIDAPGNSGNVIKDLTTGVIYPSQNAACKALGINPSNLSHHLNGKNVEAGGHVFEKLIDGGKEHVLQVASQK